MSLETKQQRDARIEAYRKWLKEQMRIIEFVDPNAADLEIPEDDIEGDDE